MIVRYTLALLLSIAGHYLWLSSATATAAPKVSGGANKTVQLVSISLAPKAKPKPPKPVAKKIVKQAVKKAVKKVNKKRIAKTEPKPVVVPSPPAPVKPSEPEPVSVATKQIEKPQPGIESLPIVREVRFRQPPKSPVYPKLALRRKQQGEALVQALVNAEGETEKVEIRRSSGFDSLDRSAIKAVSQWVFAAARVDGKSVKAWVEVPVEFKLN